MENFRIFLGWCCPFSHIQYTSIPPFAGFSSLLGIFTAEFISFSQFQLHLIQSLLFFCYFVRYRENFHHKHLFFGSFAQNHCILFFSYKIWTPEWLDFHVIATLQNAPGKTVFFFSRWSDRHCALVTCNWAHDPSIVTFGTQTPPNQNSLQAPARNSTNTYTQSRCFSRSGIEPLFLPLYGQRPLSRSHCHRVIRIENETTWFNPSMTKRPA